MTSVIIFSWFSTKTFISNNSEENLSFINFERTAKHVSTSWYPVGTGTVDVFGFVRFPFLKSLSLLQKVGFEPFLIQAFSYWIIMYIGVVFMYFLLYKGFLLSKFVSILGSYFYLFNLYTMTQVWKRNIYQGMFPWAYLPLFILLWMKWLNEGKIIWLFAFAFSTFLFSHAFAHPGYFFVYITVGGIFALIKFKENLKYRREIIKLSVRIVTACFMGIFISIWWIYPLMHNSTAQGATLDTFKDEWKIHLDSLVGVSKYFDTIDILLLRQKFFFAKDSPLSTEWFYFYNSFFSISISLVILAVVIFGIIKSKTQENLKYLLSVLLIGWFISKGSNFPLGYQFFKWLFSTFPFTAALRNPYEKFGLVLLLPYSIFFALGLNYIFGKFRTTIGRISWPVLIVIFYGVLIYPMWNGDIFPSKDRLTIPRYYLEANDYLNSHLSKRSFHIPFSIQAELLKYSWGYVGQEPSENLFDSQNVSRSDVSVFNDYYLSIPKLLNKNYLPRVLGLLGVDYVILHHDMIYPQLDPNLVKIDQWQEITNASEFGQLTLYRLDESIVRPEIFATTSLVEFDSLEQALDKISTGEFDAAKSVFINAKKHMPVGGGDTSISIEFEKTALNRFQVQVENTTEPFILVLNHTYNNFWEARIDNQKVDDHFLVNGFANGWLIEKIGDYKVDIVLKIWPWD